ncbi:SDR family NAD(P)-dependent oxidoreductase [Nocardiopsis sp. NPDC006938]|uniref:SDR family NAD(P)-dependent oxidoreductase n=1 Tax=Nocardiopsis sp. NPDC006938 TaxID=3364337 RepID=UPI0036C3AAD6
MNTHTHTDTDRCAVITGAGSPRGIGLATAARLAADGFAIAILDIDGDAASAAAEQISAEYSVPTLAATADVTSEESVDQAFAAVEGSHLPPVTALVNNAGITAPTRFADITLDEWRRIFAVNVEGTFLATRRALPGMRERGHGRVVNLSSVSAQRGGGVFGGSHYSAAKGAVLGLTRALAREAAPDGVVVNAVTPGFIGTDITAGKLTDERRAQLIEEIPVGRGGDVADVAGLIAYLCGPEVGYVTGATFDVNGGSHIH